MSNDTSRLSVADRLNRRTDTVFAEQERQGLMLAAKVRLIGIAIIIFIALINRPEFSIGFVVEVLEIVLFGLLGWLQYLSAKHRYFPNVLKFTFVFIDCALLAFVLARPDPFDIEPIPPAVLMDSGRAAYFLIFLMQATFSFRPLLVLWCGLCIIAARLAMLFWFLSMPDVFTDVDLSEQTIAALIAARPDGNFVFLGFLVTELTVVLLVTAGLATVVRRSRTLVQNQARAERTRASLARYFSPNVVDRLGDSNDLLHEGREQKVAVLFADIVGFTNLSEHQSPRQVVSLLREYHDRLVQAVFDNNGTLDKYIGDGLMATFGTPTPGARDAPNALCCALQIVDSLDQWNQERRRMGVEPVRVGIGLHYGPVVAGDIGSERRLEYSVIGDTVNIASRLEHMTRRFNTPLVVSDAVIKALPEGDENLLDSLRNHGVEPIRGREAGIDIWIYATGNRS